MMRPAWIKVLGPAPLALVLCLLLAFLGVTNHGAWKTDEPRVAAIALEMSVSNNYVIPHLAGEAFVEKPPLYYAMGAVLVKLLAGLFGTIGSIRLTSSLCALATLFFVYLLARRLLGKDRASLSVMVLATMGGFINESHLIRVDIALLLFVTAGAWSMAEAYLGGRSRCLLLAGLFAGLAFLTKGAVGFAFLGVIWASAFLPWAWPRWKQRHTQRLELWVAMHLGALAVVAGVLSLWIIPFRTMAGPELWKQWFWDNQIGRLLGSAELGHTGDGNLRPFFYLTFLVLSPMPWTPLLGAWIWQTKKLSREHILLVGWTVGSFLMLTLASTKRGVYFLPALPPLALMVAEVMAPGLRRWQRSTYRVVAVACILFLVGQLLVPSAANLSASLPAGFILPVYGAHHLVLLVAVLAAGYLLFWSPASLCTRVIAVIAITYASCLTVNVAVLDTRLGLEKTVSSFLHSIPGAKRKTAASFRFDERTRARLYLCDQEVFPAVKIDRVNRILTGGDPEFDSVIMLRTDSLAQVRAPYRVMAKAYLDDPLDKPKDRWVYWLVPDP